MSTGSRRMRVCPSPGEVWSHRSGSDAWTRLHLGAKQEGRRPLSVTCPKPHPDSLGQMPWETSSHAGDGTPTHLPGSRSRGSVTKGGTRHTLCFSESRRRSVRKSLKSSHWSVWTGHWSLARTVLRVQCPLQVLISPGSSLGRQCDLHLVFPVSPIIP